jgi:uncharacterized membrane protein
MLPTPTPRLALVDALRGFAVAQMIVYHFIYDLNYFGWLQLRMLSDQPWTGWRTGIVTQFLLLVGVSLMLRTSFKPSLADFARRWAEVAGAALLVSIGSWFMFGPRFIWFGILHFIVVALLIARPLLPLGRANLAIGAVAIVIGLTVSHEAFNAAPASALGLTTRKPFTEDYVPLLPWIGVVLIGAGLGAWWKKNGWTVTAALQPLNRRPPRLLVLLGTWALTVYLIHQPILIGALSLARMAGL